jgi:hypothetical protein
MTYPSKAQAELRPSGRLSAGRNIVSWGLCKIHRTWRDAHINVAYLRAAAGEYAARRGGLPRGGGALILNLQFVDDLLHVGQSRRGLLEFSTQ